MIVKPRRIVTGIDEEGNSIIQSNKVLDPSIESFDNLPLCFVIGFKKSTAPTYVRYSGDLDKEMIRYFVK